MAVAVKDASEKLVYDKNGLARKTIRGIEYYVDIRDNMWDISKFIYGNLVMDIHAGLFGGSTGCVNCINCIRCTNCVECDKCNRCVNSTRSFGCVDGIWNIDCEYCISCEACMRCVDCRNCDACVGGTNLMYRVLVIVDKDVETSDN